MKPIQDDKLLISLLIELSKLPKEAEWVEFKHNNADPNKIGAYISALANSAALIGKQSAYVVWGINDKDHSLLGTTFKSGLIKHYDIEAGVRAIRYIPWWA